jgi:hypothetical protein
VSARKTKPTRPIVDEVSDISLRLESIHYLLDAELNNEPSLNFDATNFLADRLRDQTALLRRLCEGK